MSADNPTFKKRIPPKPLPTFRELVTQYGDDWGLLAPLAYMNARDPYSSDALDAVRMTAMERGKLGRIEE